MVLLSTSRRVPTLGGVAVGSSESEVRNKVRGIVKRGRKAMDNEQCNRCIGRKGRGERRGGGGGRGKQKEEELKIEKEPQRKT